MPRQKQQNQTKYFCLTINNFEDDDKKVFQELFDEGKLSYFIWGEEIGESGTPHLQCYVEYASRVRATRVAKDFRKRAHVCIRNGTADQAASYCRKEGRNIYECGTLSKGQGARNDLVALQSSLDSGRRLVDVAGDHFREFLRYERSIRSYRLLRSERRTWSTDVRVLWGETGTGKSRRVHESCDPDELYVWPGNGCWFDGYDSHSNVLFDDFSGSSVALPYLLKLLDRYPFSVPIKGGYVNWNPRIIWITSNINPDEWYPNAHGEHRAALRRRFTTVQHFLNLL